jgi:hypothetical protein
MKIVFEFLSKRKVLWTVVAISIFIVSLVILDWFNVGSKYLPNSPLSNADRVIGYLSLLFAAFFSSIAALYTNETTKPAIQIEFNQIGSLYIRNEGQTSVNIGKVEQKRLKCSAKDYGSQKSKILKKLSSQNPTTILNTGLKLAPKATVYNDSSLTHVGEPIENSQVWLIETVVSGQDTLNRKFTARFIHAWFNDPERLLARRTNYLGWDNDKAQEDFREHLQANIQSNESWAMIHSD